MTMKPTAETRLISTLTAFSPFPPKPKPTISTQNLSSKHQNNQFSLSRRDAVFFSILTLTPPLSPPEAANAFSIGICTET